METQPTNAWRATLKRRIIVAASALLLWSAAVEARLVFLQVVQYAELSARAERQQMRTVEAPAKRGELLDRRGRVLAYSVDADSIYAVPTDIDDAEQAAALLCGALDDCSSQDRLALAERIDRGRAFVYVRRQATPEQAKRVAELELEGVGFMKESRRFYPNKDLAAHILGYVGIDNVGLGGIEATYDSLIKGRPGTVLIQTDARRRAFSRVERSSTAGATLELTIDEYLQHIVERELQAGVKESDAAGGSAIVLDPASGEILAMASYPTFNPNAYGDFREQSRRNRAVQDLFEPGSTFKIITAGAALEEKVVQAEDQIDVSEGLIRFGSRVINDDRRYGILSFEDVIVKSSNVGAIKVGLRLGAERLDTYVKRFGFGRSLSPDFSGESAGIVWDASKLNDSALASIAMGYQVGVTPLQMAAAASAIANGGELIEPRVVRAVLRDGHRVAVPRKTLGRTVSAGTAVDLTTIMEAVVERGTATLAKVPGYRIAGKTGTAAKIVDGRYSTSDYNVSFVGFVPSRDPVFTIIVVIDSPSALSPYGGVVAAPVFQRIADGALRHYGVPPTIDASPPVMVTRRAGRQQPAAARPAGMRAIVPVSDPVTGSDAVFPDLRGLSARDALRMLTRLGVSAQLSGVGLVMAQQPEAGTPIRPGVVGALRLGRWPVSRPIAGGSP